MKSSSDRILTSHAGSLPRPDDLIATNAARDAGTARNEQAFQDLLKRSVTDVVQKQREAGVDVPGDGEFGKSMGQKINYGAWLSYSFGRLSGFEMVDKPAPPRLSGDNNLALQGLYKRRDRTKFLAAYDDPESGISVGRFFARPICTGPVTYTGQDAIKADIANFKSALKANGMEEGFMTSIGPASASRLGNIHYATDQEFLFACADAMREEYKAIIDAGLILQIDDPAIAENWDQIVPEPSVREYVKFTMLRVEALNHALRGFPEDRIRFHLCWGSWHGPHVTDLPMRDIIDVMLAIKSQAYSFEAGNVRHEHEWSVWRDVKLP